MILWMILETAQHILNILETFRKQMIIFQLKYVEYPVKLWIMKFGYPIAGKWNLIQVEIFKDIP